MCSTMTFPRTLRSTSTGLAGLRGQERPARQSPCSAPGTTMHSATSLAGMTSRLSGLRRNNSRACTLRQAGHQVGEGSEATVLARLRRAMVTAEGMGAMAGTAPHAAGDLMPVEAGSAGEATTEEGERRGPDSNRETLSGTCSRGRRNTWLCDRGILNDAARPDFVRVCDRGINFCHFTVATRN